MLYPAPDEYAMLRVDDLWWKILKFSGHHGIYLTTYDIKINEEGFYCTCMAGHNCKHIYMVIESLQQPKKELF
jgi:hypothetical protein